MFDLDNLEAAIESIARTEKKYHSNSYRFVIMAVGSLIRMKLKLHETSDGKHVQIDYNEQIQWMKIYGWYNFGMMTKTVFNRWGLKTSHDLLDVLKLLMRHDIVNKDNFKTRYSPSYVVSGFDFADYEKEDLFSAYYPI